MDSIDSMDSIARQLVRAAMVAAFHRVAQAQAEARTVAEPRRELRFEPGGVDHDIAHAGASEGLEMPFDQRLAAHLEQRLGRRVGQRTHALAATGREDERSGRGRHRGIIGAH